YRAPRHQVGDVLRGNHVEKLTAGGYAQGVDIQQQLPRRAHALVDIEAVVEVGPIDQSLPAHGRAGCFEVHPPDDCELAALALPSFTQPTGVIQGGFGVVDGARADNDGQPVVHAVQDAVQAITSLIDDTGNRFAARKLAHQMRWRRQLFDFSDT